MDDLERYKQMMYQSQAMNAYQNPYGALGQIGVVSAAVGNSGTVTVHRQNVPQEVQPEPEKVLLLIEDEGE